jgi:hypothetical protein
MPQVLDWAALSVDGKPLERREYIGTANLPVGALRSMEVVTNHPAAPRILVKCRPEKDETIRCFTRRTMPVFFGGQAAGPTQDTVVLEVSRADGTFVRLYMRGDGTLVLSSEEHHG